MYVASLVCLFFCHPLYVIDSTKNMQQKADNVICTETRHMKAVIIMQSAHVSC